MGERAKPEKLDSSKFFVSHHAISVALFIALLYSCYSCCSSSSSSSSSLAYKREAPIIMIAD
jgi:hypothetical protein